jgi:hypothetical protein
VKWLAVEPLETFWVVWLKICRLGIQLAAKLVLVWSMVADN